MTKYRIHGDLVQKYYIDVEADSILDAYDIADAARRDEWTQLETDDVIESYTHDILDSLEDGYPSMDNEIIITN